MATIQHFDKLGYEITVGCCVVYPSSNMLSLGRVTKLNPKMVKVTKIPGGKWSSESNKYPADVLVVDDAAVSMYLLKGGK